MSRTCLHFSATEHHRRLTGTKLYRVITEVHVCEHLAQCIITVYEVGELSKHDISSSQLLLLNYHYC